MIFFSFFEVKKNSNYLIFREIRPIMNNKKAILIGFLKFIYFLENKNCINAPIKAPIIHE